MRGYFLLGLTLTLCGWVAGTLAVPVSAANSPTKQTVMVPMRDGIHLATDVRLPAGDGPWPVALLRTVYGRLTLTAVPVPLSNLGQFAQNGIALVVQDTRGR